MTGVELGNSGYGGDDTHVCVVYVWGKKTHNLDWMSLRFFGNIIARFLFLRVCEKKTGGGSGRWGVVRKKERKDCCCFIFFPQFTSVSSVSDSLNLKKKKKKKKKRKRKIGCIHLHYGKRVFS